MFWFMEGTCFLPSFLVAWSSATFLISYIIAVLRQDVDPVFPYISDTGAESPESAVFGLMTTITAFASVATMFARYKYVEKIQEALAKARPRFNMAAFGVGLTSCLGMCIVGTFQVTVLTIPHDVGAVLFFIFGVTYIILQSVISYHTHPYGSSLGTCRTRALISGISLLAAIPMIVCAAFLPSEQHWDTHDKNYSIHIASAVCEWTVTFCFVFFFLTYVREFKRLALTITAEILD